MYRGLWLLQLLWTFSSVNGLAPQHSRKSSSKTIPTMTATAGEVPVESGDSTSLLSIIQRSFPDAKSYSVQDNIKQANAEGFGVVVKGIEKNTTNLFVKQVEASKYSHKPWGDLRRTLLYSRTEARFYSDILPLMREKTKCGWDIAPNCFLAETTLDGLIAEHESTSAKENESADDPSYDENDTTVFDNRGGLLVLESLKSNFYQKSPLTPEEATECLEAIAKFHATAYEDGEVLKIVSDRLCEYGGSYHLKNRNPKELKNIQKTWADFCDGVKSAAPEFFEQSSVRTLAERIQNMAQSISEELSPAYNAKYATIVHGDYKAMNVFIASKEEGSEDKSSLPIIIDFASTGVGLGMSDVAMHITHAVPPQHLVDGGEDKLVEKYLDALNEALPDQQSYPKDVAMRHYRLAVIDYFRFIMGRLWRGASIETFEKRKDSMNSVYVNRSIEAAINFIERADKYLADFEKERNGSHNA
mmetsp:Transcript_18785/g.52483  ORF Transcript_18785/g.52483 Transcript_18785/m.52483 type:complete len:473 (-) Transcript_18785:39-1457(-)